MSDDYEHRQEAEIERLRAINAELVLALEKITQHFADVMNGPFLAGVTFKNGVEGIPTIAAARDATAKAKAKAKGEDK